MLGALGSKAVGVSRRPRESHNHQTQMMWSCPCVRVAPSAQFAHHHHRYAAVHLVDKCLCSQWRFRAALRQASYCMPAETALSELRLFQRFPSHHPGHRCSPEIEVQALQHEAAPAQTRSKRLPKVRKSVTTGGATHKRQDLRA